MTIKTVAIQEVGPKKFLVVRNPDGAVIAQGSKDGEGIYTSELAHPYADLCGVAYENEWPSQAGSEMPDFDKDEFHYINGVPVGPYPKWLKTTDEVLAFLRDFKAAIVENSTLTLEVRI